MDSTSVSCAHTQLHILYVCTHTSTHTYAHAHTRSLGHVVLRILHGVVTKDGQKFLECSQTHTLIGAEHFGLLTYGALERTVLNMALIFPSGGISIWKRKEQKKMSYGAVIHDTQSSSFAAAHIALCSCGVKI